MFRTWAKARLQRLCALVRRVDKRAGEVVVRPGRRPLRGDGAP